MVILGICRNDIPHFSRILLIIHQAIYIPSFLALGSRTLSIRLGFLISNAGEV